MIGKYSAKRMDNGDVVEGNLIFVPGDPFSYILTKENKDRMIVDDFGKCECFLIRVLEYSIKQL